MKAPSEQTIKRLFAHSGNRCAFTGCTTAIVQPSGTVTGKICHIKAKSPNGPRYDHTQKDEERHAYENLILLCSVHHDIVDAEPQRFTVELLKDFKEIHERYGNVELTQNDVRFVHRLLDSYLHIEASGEAQVMVDSPGSIQAKHVTIKTGAGSLPSIQPADAVGSNIEMKAYVEYLVKKYIDWRTKGKTMGKDKRPFHPSMTHQLVERSFGARTYLVPQSRFEELVTFLQTAINGTIVGQMTLRKGSRNYHSFNEHLEILRGKKGRTRGG